MPRKLSSLARAATSTTLPILVPSLVTTASPVLTAVHAICCSAMRLMIEPGKLGGFDRGGLAEDLEEQRLTSEPLRLMIQGDRAASAQHHELGGRSKGELGCPGALFGHPLR